MYYLCGPRANAETLATLARPYLVDRSASVDGRALRRGYVAFLRATQSGLPAAPDDDGVTFSSASTGHTALRAAFGYDDVDEPPTDDPWDLEQLRAAQELLGDVDSTLREIFDAATVVVYSPSVAARPGSGTLYAGVGVMYVNPAREWSLGDICEAYVHELTHILLSLDEARHQHYYDYAEMDKPENQLQTAILRQRRPVHLCFHSAIVAHEIIGLRGALEGFGLGSSLHGPTERLTETTLMTLDEITAFPRLNELVTPRVEELLRAARDGIARHAALGAT